MLDKKYLERIRAEATVYDSGRRETIRLSDDIRNASKRSIFALHRGDVETADRLLSEATDGVGSVLSRAREIAQLSDEGSFRSALEEYAEARLYRSYLRGERLGPIAVGEFEVPADIFLGGLCDLVGELQRRQVRLATEGDIDGVRGVRDLAEEIVGSLLEMDLTGYLRNKFDQAKNSFRRSEEVLYEMSVRRA
ncbi:MAG: hypothetical protein ABIJ46_03065 [bacterium]